MTSKKIRISAYIYGVITLIYFLFELNLVASLFYDNSSYYTLRTIDYTYYILKTLKTFCISFLPTFILICISCKFSKIEPEKCQGNSLVKSIISRISDKKLKTFSLFIILLVIAKLTFHIISGTDFIVLKSGIELIYFIYHNILWPAFLSIVLLAVSYVYSDSEKNKDTEEKYYAFKILTIIYGIVSLLHLIFSIIMTYKTFELSFYNSIFNILLEIYITFIPILILICISRLLDNKVKKLTLFSSKKIKVVIALLTVIMIADGFFTRICFIISFSEGLPFMDFVENYPDYLFDIIPFPFFCIMMLLIINKVNNYLRGNKKTEGNDIVKDISKQ